MLSTCGLRGVWSGMQSFLLYYDDKSTLHIAVNPTFHEQTKHNLKLNAT